MTATDPVAIARRLSPAQKHALLWLPGDGGVVVIDRAAPSMIAREYLRAMGLMDAAPSGYGAGVRMATPLGLAVRAVLVKEGGE